MAIKSVRFMAKTTFPCVDLKVESPAEVIKEGESRKGVLTFIDEDHFHFVEAEAKVPNAQKSFPERRYKDLVGSLHGRISKNDHGVILHMYVRHEDYQNANALADIFEREVEQMCNELADMDIEEAQPCGK